MSTNRYLAGSSVRLALATTIIGVCSLPVTGDSQISLSGTTYQENFNTIGTTATATLPSGYKMTAAGDTTVSWTDGTNVTATTIAASTGSPATGGRYNWGDSSNTTDRSIGFMSSSGYAEPNSILAAFVNGTGSTITSLDLTFDLERYRINSAGLTNFLYFSTDGSTWGSALNTFTWGTGTSAYDFTPTTGEGSVQNRSLTIGSLSLASGSSFYLRWEFDATASTNSQGVGLDNISLMLSTLAVALNYWDLNGSLDGLGFVNPGDTATWDTTTTNWTGTADGHGAPAPFDSTRATIFSGNSGTVEVVSTGVSADGGVTFDSDGYTVAGTGMLNLGGSTPTVTAKRSRGGRACAFAATGSREQ